MLRLSTPSLSAPLRTICLRCEVGEFGVGWGHVGSANSGLCSRACAPFQMGRDCHPSTCGRDPLVWAGCGHRGPHPKCPMGGGVAPPRVGGVARHVKMTHRVEGPRRMNLGMVWMEGTAGGAVQRAVLPWADRMTWMQTPSEGACASIWVRWEDAQRNRTWSVHAAWAPSQQVAFRCALRLSWEA